MTENFQPTGAQFEIRDGAIVFTLGGERTAESAAKERRWFDDQLEKSPGQKLGLAIDFKNVKAEQAETVGVKTLATRLLRDEKVGAIAIIKAGKGYQVIIRSIVFALTSETGKLKFFDTADAALEWLKIKASNK